MILLSSDHPLTADCSRKSLGGMGSRSQPFLGADNVCVLTSWRNRDSGSRSDWMQLQLEVEAVASGAACLGAERDLAMPKS